ncbi:MAG: 4-(cytidine 5'-diphospho)-2-C-methyl-D-erythritol kinase [Bacteroidales bacterium]|nr:4-(cytidine 5'-diphospho)-2-C-methyl-D-erythritol kinase [Bacteroidales bacterium]
MLSWGIPSVGDLGPFPVAGTRFLWVGPQACVLATPAKLNLFLELQDKRSDGFHTIETLMVAVDLYDTLELQSRTDGQFLLCCDPTGLPTGPDNLVWKAAAALQQASATTAGASIRLTKRIPHAAGLGGGSSDAAATLLGLNHLWNLHYPRERLLEIAATIGSDVGFFLNAEPAAWCTGRGEVTTPVPLRSVFDFVIVKPAIGLSTAAVYRHAIIPEHPIAGAEILNALPAGDQEQVARNLTNRLEQPAFALAPEVASVAGRLRALNPLGCLLAGSGSSVFAVCRDRADAVRIAQQFLSEESASKPASQVFAVRSVRWP